MRISDWSSDVCSSDLKWTIDRAHDLGATVLCGPFHSAFTVFSKQAPTEQEYEWSADVLRKAGDHAAQAGVLLTPEAVNRFECYLCNTMEQLTYLLEKTDRKRTRLNSSHYCASRMPSSA